MCRRIFLNRSTELLAAPPNFSVSSIAPSGRPYTCSGTPDAESTISVLPPPTSTTADVTDPRSNAWSALAKASLASCSSLSTVSSSPVFSRTSARNRSRFFAARTA